MEKKFPEFSLSCEVFFHFDFYCHQTNFYENLGEFCVGKMVPLQMVE